MSTRAQVVLGLALAGVGAVALVILLATTGSGSVRGHVADHYRLVSTEDGGRSREYASAEPPSQVVDSIAGRWKPADRINDSAGYFLRYRDDYVVVSSDGAGDDRPLDPPHFPVPGPRPRLASDWPEKVPQLPPTKPYQCR